MLAIPCVFATAPAQAQEAPLSQIISNNGTLTRAQAQAALQKQFAKLDTNHDGVISSSEFVDARLQMFDEADSNGDSTLTLAEMRAFALSHLWMHDGEPQKPR